MLKNLNNKFGKVNAVLANGYIKVYSETAEEHRDMQKFCREEKIEFYVIRPLSERPFKIVMKGLHRDTDMEEIKSELAIALPEIEILKTRCLKCGEDHRKNQCPITTPQENPKCINCGVTCHITSWRGGPLFPKIKPTKGQGVNYPKAQREFLATQYTRQENISYSMQTQKLIPRQVELNSRQESEFNPQTGIREIDQLNEHLAENKILCPEQFGFRKSLTTTHQLLRVVEYITSGFEKGECTGAVFLDVQKAFDRVWIQGLIHKLIRYKTPPHLLKLLKSYLEERKFAVKVGNSISEAKIMRAGIPQGGKILPVLYSLYVNDIPKTHKTL
ncbi:putative RNA-directed DNA polymerase from transposon BS [Araneus ventricosus]|uniref:Putative RNA-directed DNA polymerase from transposon BS n=1 Tax=Araneus ventricosus TaxID=182803 RepID=A0A4Y2Q643_ARAVE|nr:putative RNA-directed DNA polymerase from transposon BS [Araneus ventricosus]